MKSGCKRTWKRIGRAALAFCMVVTLFPIRAFSVGPGVSVYEAFADEGSVALHTEFLSSVENAESAADAVSRQAHAMTEEQKNNPADVHQAILFAEEAVASAARKPVEGAVIHISAETVGDLAEKAQSVRDGVSKALRENGVAVTRPVPGAVTLETTAPGFTLIIHSDILDTAAEKIQVTKVTDPGFSVTFRPADLTAELRPDAEEENPQPRTLTITVLMTADECEPGTEVPIPKVRVDVPDGQLSAPITLSMNPGCREPSALTVEGVAGEAAACKYNPASRTLDARLDASDVYTFGKRNVYFTDLVEKDRKVRTAVEALARVNVVYGYQDHTFRPEQTVTRAEFVAFVMRALGRVNNSLKSVFPDVTEESGCYHEVSSAYYYGIIRGYDDGLFHGERPINKTQIYAILGRILQGEMGYWAPEDPSEYLAEEFSDEVDLWAREDISIAVREGLVIRQSTGRFDGSLMMNRGDVALIIYGLYQRIA